MEITIALTDVWAARETFGNASKCECVIVLAVAVAFFFEGGAAALLWLLWLYQNCDPNGVDPNWVDPNGVTKLRPKWQHYSSG